MMKIKKLIIDNIEIITYLIFGVLTTLVNIVTYYITKNIFDFNYIVSTIISWIAAVLFAFITNKYFVFKTEKKGIVKELFLFVLMRLFSLLVDIALMFIMVDLLNINDLVAKVVANVVIIVLNYVLSKLIIFKKEK